MLDPTNIKFTDSYTHENITLTFTFLRPTLHIEWNDFVLIGNQTPLRSAELPTSIPLPLFSHNTFRQFDPITHAELIVGNNGEYHFIPAADTSRNLYPTLEKV